MADAVLYGTDPEPEDVILHGDIEQQAGVAERASGSDLGFTSRLPTYDNLCEYTHAQRRSFIVLRPSVAVTDWSSTSGDMYSSGFSKVYRGLTRDVLSVLVYGQAPLYRVETPEECEVTPYSFCYRPDQEFEHESFYWGQSYWRTSSPSANEGWWGQFARLFVNLDGLNPADLAIVAELGFYISQDGEVHPTLGEDLLFSNGLMEAVPVSSTVTSSSVANPTVVTTSEAHGLATGDVVSIAGHSGSTPSLNGQSAAITVLSGTTFSLPVNVTVGGTGGTVQKAVPSGFTYATTGSGYVPLVSNFTPQEGVASFQITGSGVTSGNASISRDVDCTVGSRYRVSGSYYTGDVVGGASEAYCALETLGAYVQSDGRSLGPSYEAGLLKSTGAAWRRFTFDFIAPAGTVTLRLISQHVSGTADSFVAFDKVTVKNVVRLDTYEARIGEGDIPPSTTGSPSIFFSGKSVGVGSISVRNADGALDYAIGQLVWIGRKIEHWVGGEVGGLGVLDREEWERRFTGIVQSMEFDDDKVTFAIEDFRSKFHKTLPPNIISTGDINVEPNARGKPAPMLFGSKIGIRPWRVGMAGSYGQYLVADTTNWDAGIFSIDDVYAYVDDTAASEIDTTRRVQLNLPQIERAPNAITYGITSSSSPSSYQTSYTKTGTSSWAESYGSSRLLLHGDGYVEFTSGGVTNTAVACGLSASHAEKVNFDDINYSWNLLAAGTVQPYELGVAKSTAPARTGNQRYRVQRDGSTITYWTNDGVGGDWTLHYTSATTYTGPLQLKFSIFTANATVYAISMYGFGEVSTDISEGTFVVNEDVTPFEVTVDNQLVNFNIGASELTATVPVGLYTAVALAKEITYRMKTVASDLVCSYSQSGNTFTINRPSGTLNLLLQTGANKEASIWGLIGFGRSANKTAASTYTGENAVYEVSSIETSHVLRCDARGYADDDEGTYTGTPNSLIQRGCDIAKALVTRWLFQPDTAINASTFLSARTYAPESLAIYLGESTSSVDIFDRLESSNIANIVVAGDGTVHYIVYAYNNETVPESRHIEEKDYLGKPVFSRQGEEVFSAVTILYDQRPDSGIWKAETAENVSEAQNYDAIIPKEIETYVRLRDTAEVLAARMLVLAQRPPVRVSVTSSAKIFRAKVGDIVSLTRKRVLSATATAANVPYRIISISPDAINGVVKADLVEAQALPAGINCVSTCQTVCQAVAQNECAVVTQSGCAVACQDSCQVNCQVCGQASSCQTSCESGCQATCESNCQVCGQASSCQTCGQAQGTCQASCQLSEQGGGGCVASCETACQVCGQAALCQTCGQSASCQTCGQGSNCQDCGQASNCQSCGQGSNCQDCGQGSNCQDCGQVSSGSNCQNCGQAAGPCQTTCQTGGCETSCQFGCQGTCQETNQGPLQI
jgi:hypothetical protein